MPYLNRNRNRRRADLPAATAPDLGGGGGRNRRSSSSKMTPRRRLAALTLRCTALALLAAAVAVASIVASGMPGNGGGSDDGGGGGMASWLPGGGLLPGIGGNADGDGDGAAGSWLAGLLPGNGNGGNGLPGIGGNADGAGGGSDGGNWLAGWLAGGNGTPGGFGGGGGGVGVAHAQTGGDYDDDNDGLIEVRNLAQLDAIRYDLNGDGMRGSVSASDWARYTAAFPNAVSGMGCPATCTGYELRNSLDFDTNGNGQADSGDAYWNGGQGWASIGGFTFADFAPLNTTGTYTATFDGNKDDGYSISNLYINRAFADVSAATTFPYSAISLFTRVAGNNGVLRDVRIVNPNITVRRSGTSARPHAIGVGALSGFLGTGATVTGIAVEGGEVNYTQGTGQSSEGLVGCMTGRATSFGSGTTITISASYATCAVNYTSPLVDSPPLAVSPPDRDSNNGTVGGLLGAAVGSSSGVVNINTSYATGDITCSDLGKKTCGGLVGEAGGGTMRSNYATGNVVNQAYYAPTGATACNSAAFQYASHTGALFGKISVGSIVDSYATGRVTSRFGDVFCPFTALGGLVGNASAGDARDPGVITNSYWDSDTTGLGFIGAGRPTGTTSAVRAASGGRSTAGARTTTALKTPTGYAAPSSGNPYANWNWDVDGVSGNDNPWHFGTSSEYPVLQYRDITVGQQRLTAEAGDRQEAFSGQPVTLSGSGGLVPGFGVLDTGESLTYAWTQTGDPPPAQQVTLSGASTARATFTAPTGLTEDTTLEFTLTVGRSSTAATYTVTDTVAVRVQAVLPNQLLSLGLTDAEGDAVGLAPAFVSSTYTYDASVANQIGSVTLTPVALDNTAVTVNGAAAASGSGVEVPLKYRGNEIVIVVTPPGLEADDGADGNGDSNGDDAEEVTPCDEENVGGKVCTYTVTVRRAVPPRLAFSARSLTIDEGGAGTYTVELDTRILTGAVTIAITTDNPAVTVSPTEVTLKPLDMAPRTIRVTAAADDDRDDESVVITHTANGAHYYDVVATVGVLVNDTTAPPPDPAVTASVATLELREGGSGRYTVALAAAPAGAVSVAIASDNGDVTAMPAALAFTADNWDTGQWVTVSAAADNDAAPDTATLTHTASGGGYDAAAAARVRVSVTDDDRAGLAIAPDEVAITENGSGAFRVTLGTQPTANVTVAIASDNADVSVRPAGLVFTAGNWDTGQAVTVSARVDQGGGDELATVRLTASGGGYDGLRGNVLVSVDDRLAPVITTTRPGAPAGVSVYGPAGSGARATVAAAGINTPTMATGAGFGIGPAVGVAVTRGPAGGLEVCLPVADDLRMQADAATTDAAAVLTLLRSIGGGAWAELAGARDLGDRVCAGGVTGAASYAAGYALKPGTVLDLAASAPADAPGTIELTWTPPAAGTAQVAVVVNAADDTDYCLETLAGLGASRYACADRTAGQTYVALLIVLLPDGGYTLANIVRFELPAGSAPPPVAPPAPSQ